MTKSKLHKLAYPKYRGKSGTAKVGSKIVAITLRPGVWTYETIRGKKKK
jgi:hypothetical protein